jgi:hypothetical protein
MYRRITIFVPEPEPRFGFGFMSMLNQTSMSGPGSTGRGPNLDRTGPWTV